MARSKTIEISGLNIVTQPHKPEDYIWFFNYISKSKKYIPIRGSDCIMLCDISPISDDDPLEGIKGTILKFSKIDSDADWADITSAVALSDNEIPKIPSNLQPNASFIPFVFYPKGKERAHKLFYISKSRDSSRKKNIRLSPNLLKKFFEAFTEDANVKEKFRTLKVTVLPSSSALEKVLSLDFIRRLDLVIYAPNPDSPNLRAQMKQRMENMNVEKIEESYISDGGSIEPDTTLRAEAEVAAENGQVISYGRVQGRTVKRSTSDIPMARRVQVDTSSPQAERYALQQFKYNERD